MKFGLFYEVQTPKPVDSDDWAPGQEAQKFSETLDQIELADRVGFDYIWVAEHHFTPEYTHTSAPDLLLAAASQRTHRIRLGTGVIQMPPAHNHPARVAERIATLDVLSSGRMEFGTGEGGPAELDVFLADSTNKKDMWRESTRECLRMLALTPYPGYEGDYVRMPSVTVVPRPLQKPHPPVWVACTQLGTVVEAGHLGMGSLVLTFGSADTARERVDAYWSAFHERLQPIGFSINPAVAAFSTALCARSDDEAWRRERGGAAYFAFTLRRSMEVLREPGHHLHREFQERAAAMAAAPPPLAAEAHADQSMIGSPETLRRSLRAYEATNVDILALTIQSGDRQHADIMESLELLGREVFPEFKERQAEHDRWREQQLSGVDADLSENSSV
jgi:alkanesulfonate monooxygenase SsuD/methylene tetrahydromethanopterin reductase-like flavin-dependent oxidoreductase (luciferase family)